jgi:hypothetical protein
MCFSCDTNLEECRDCDSLFCLNCDLVLNKEQTDKIKPNIGFYDSHDIYESINIFNDNDEYLDILKQLQLIHYCNGWCDWQFHNCKNCRPLCGCNNCLKIDSVDIDSVDSSINSDMQDECELEKEED